MKFKGYITLSDLEKFAKQFDKGSGDFTLLTDVEEKYQDDCLKVEIIVKPKLIQGESA